MKCIEQKWLICYFFNWSVRQKHTDRSRYKTTAETGFWSTPTLLVFNWNLALQNVISTQGIPLDLPASWNRLIACNGMVIPRRHAQELRQLSRFLSGWSVCGCLELNLPGSLRRTSRTWIDFFCQERSDTEQRRNIIGANKRRWSHLSCSHDWFSSQISIVHCVFFSYDLFAL